MVFLFAKLSKENQFILVLYSALVYIKSKEIIKLEHSNTSFASLGNLKFLYSGLNPVQMCCKNMQIRVQIHVLLT